MEQPATAAAVQAQTARILHLADDSEALGHATLAELDTQRDQLLRIAERTAGVDARLSRSRRILNAMGRCAAARRLTLLALAVALTLVLALVLALKVVAARNK